MVRAFLALLLLSFPAPLKEPTETQKAQGETFVTGNDSAWDLEFRNGEWFLRLGLGAGGRLGWAARGPPLKLHPAREWRWAFRKMVEQGHLENLDFSAV